MPKDSPRSPAAPMLPARRRSPRACTVKDEVNSEEVDSIQDGSAVSGLGGVGAALHLKMRDVGPAGAQKSCYVLREKLEASENRVKAVHLIMARWRAKLDAKTEKMLDLRSQLQEMKNDMEMVERESDRKDELLDAARKDAEQYRTWWLNEIQFMKLMLNKVPEPNKDIDLVRAAQAHYFGHY